MIRSDTDAETASTIARELAAARHPGRVTVRSLRDRFGRARLTPSGRAEIAEALERAGVVLGPGFERASLDDEVVLRLRRAGRRAGRWRGRLLPRASRAWKAAVAVLSLLGTIVGLYAFLEPRLWPDPPPEPEPLKGELNMAVAPFTATAEDAETQGEQLANRVRATLQEQFQEFGKRADVSFDIAPPPPVDPIEGATEQDRAAAAEEVAARLNADIVIYASIGVEQDRTAVVPSFFLSGRKLENAEELIGSHHLGAPLEIAGSIADSPVARVESREVLAVRTRILSDFVFGLSYFGRREYAAASRWFRQAERRSAAAGGEALEVIYLFLGHAAGRMAPARGERRMGALARAERFYRKALETDPGYARARFGLAEVRYQRANHGCRRGRADEGGLREAFRGYLSATGGSDPAYGSVLSVRSQFGRARVLFCLSRAGIEQRWDDAGTLFRRVVAAYEAGEGRLREEAERSRAGIDFIRERSPGDAPER